MAQVGNAIAIFLEIEIDWVICNKSLELRVKCSLPTSCSPTNNVVAGSRITI